MRHLGALAALAFWLLLASGTLLYILLDTSVQGAWRSIAGLADWPLGLGDLLRGLHRYAADLFLLATLAHLLREWLAGHAGGVRRFAWLTGVPLLGFVFITGIGGFWLNWDQLGQYSAVSMAEWMDALPLLASPLSRNFLAVDQVSDRLFSLFVFVHLGVPLLMLFGLWFHIQRLTRAAVWPPKVVTLSVLAMLALLALAWPVRSHQAAQLDRVPDLLRLDWILLFVHPLVDATSAGFVWALVGLGTVLLFGLPFLPGTRRAPVARVDAANCNGCQRCFVDCPYAAVTMVPHPNQRIGRLLAVVDPDLCAACGLCAGACPSSTPFRSAQQLVTGIDMPQRPVDTLRQDLRQELQACRADFPLVVFGCDHGAQLAALAAPDVCRFSLLCTGQLPPSFVEYALRDGAAGVLVLACREGGCEFRFGERWTAERLAGQREPHLRGHVDARRVTLLHAGRGDEPEARQALQSLRLRVATLPRHEEPASTHHD